MKILKPLKPLIKRATRRLFLATHTSEIARVQARRRVLINKTHEADRSGDVLAADRAAFEAIGFEHSLSLLDLDSIYQPYPIRSAL